MTTHQIHVGFLHSPTVDGRIIDDMTVRPGRLPILATDGWKAIGSVLHVSTLPALASGAVPIIVTAEFLSVEYEQGSIEPILPMHLAISMSGGTAKEDGMFVSLSGGQIVGFAAGRQWPWLEAFIAHPPLPCRTAGCERCGRPVKLASFRRKLRNV